jgi:hypothetical protein
MIFMILKKTSHRSIYRRFLYYVSIASNVIIWHGGFVDLGHY